VVAVGCDPTTDVRHISSADVRLGNIVCWPGEVLRPSTCGARGQRIQAHHRRRDRLPVAATAQSDLQPAARRHPTHLGSRNCRRRRPRPHCGGTRCQPSRQPVRKFQPDRPPGPGCGRDPDCPGTRMAARRLRYFISAPRGERRSSGRGKDGDDSRRPLGETGTVSHWPVADQLADDCRAASDGGQGWPSACLASLDG
jgi:hypothetical protein